MKYSFTLIALVAAMASAAPAELTVRTTIEEGKPFCAGRDHCVYLHKQAFTYLVDPKSPGSNKNVICESYDNNGHGRGACQFPNKVATTIECDHTGDVAFVKFGCHHSSFKFQKQTKMTLLWSSDKRKGLLPQTIDGETTEVGDDLYVRCHAGQHKHQDQSSTQTDNYGQGSNDHGSQASGSGSGSIGKSGSIDGYGSISASGSIGGSISKENYNQGLPTIH